AKATAGDGPPPDLSQSPTVTAAGTREGVILGTAAYMSPELARGTTLDKRTDIWSFGCVLYEMLTGRLAFVAATVSDTIVAILEREPDWRALPATTPAPVRHLLQRCLEKDRRQRLRDIGDARVELNEALGPPVTADTPIGHRQIRLRRAAAIALALSAAIVLIVAALVWRSPSVRPGVSDQALRLSILPPAEASFMPGSGVEISPDGRFLAFVASTGGTPQLWIRPLDAPATRPLPGTEGAESPFWSPDSRYLAFFAESKLKKVAASGGPPQTICDAALGRGGTWSTTGTIAFTPRVGGVLHSVSAAGGVPVAISRFDTSRREDAHYWPHFLPDGRHVLYFARSADPEHNAIYLIDAEAGLDAQPLRLVSGNSMAAYAAPGYLLFLSGETLVAQQFDERRLRLIGERVPVSDEVGSMGSMGQGYFSTSASGLLAHWGGDQSERRLTWMDRNSKVLGVVDAPGAYGSSRLSSDDRRAAVELVDPRTGTIGIWLLEFSRGVMSRFAVEARWDRSPVWSPSGEWIAFSSDRIAPFNLYRKATDAASTEERLTAVNRPQYPEDWSRDGRKTNSLRTESVR
ncbi:MAG: PD40 domain-containing protein, partial [Acidobacteria bacterium]|nr:PD40 domain-containing protein [Acidobacteriota bacterium]